MFTFDSVKSRLERENHHYTEFNYMILQAYDFISYIKIKDCILQIGVLISGEI